MSEQNKSFISTLKASEISELAKTDPANAFGLLNFVSSDLAAQSLNMLDSETASKVLHFSPQLKMTSFVSQLNNVEEKVIQNRKNATVVLAPIFDNVELLLGQVGPDKEGPLFDALIAAQAFTLVEEMGIRYFPSDLVLKLDLQKLIQSS